MNICLFSLSGEVDSNNTLHISSNYVSNYEKDFFSSIHAVLDYAQKSETETSIILDDGVFYLDKMLSLDSNSSLTIEGNAATFISGQLVDNNSITVHGDTLIIPVSASIKKEFKGDL